ncbi:hypothetical protein D3C74_137540 [compost metagenome]
MLGAFNGMPYNRTASFDISGSFAIELESEVLILATIEAHTGFNVDCDLELAFESVREQFGSFVLEQALEMEFNAVRERYGKFDVVCELEVSFIAGRMHVDFAEFIGEFKPGDQIIIDSDKLKMTLNGQNALHLMQGDFFDLNTGSNELIYTDDKTGRTVRMRITFKDKFV